MTYEVITHNQIIGSHYWNDAPETCAYLRDRHRHVFDIRCKFAVTHCDREIEINEMQDAISDHFYMMFPTDGAGVMFGNMSCEDIAVYCIDEFGCVECQVLEDGFGGANVRK